MSNVDLMKAEHVNRPIERQLGVKCIQYTVYVRVKMSLFSTVDKFSKPERHPRQVDGRRCTEFQHMRTYGRGMRQSTLSIILIHGYMSRRFKLFVSLLCVLYSKNTTLSYNYLSLISNIANDMLYLISRIYTYIYIDVATGGGEGGWGGRTPYSSWDQSWDLCRTVE